MNIVRRASAWWIELVRREKFNVDIEGESVWKCHIDKIAASVSSALSPNSIIIDITALIFLEDHKLSSNRHSWIYRDCWRYGKKIRLATTSSEGVYRSHATHAARLLNVPIVELFGCMLLALVRIFVLITLNVSGLIRYVLAACYTLALSCFVETLLMRAGVLGNVGQSVNRWRCLSSLQDISRRKYSANRNSNIPYQTVSWWITRRNNMITQIKLAIKRKINRKDKLHIKKINDVENFYVGIERAFK